MKLKNIVAMISFLMVAASCSMEDDVLNEMTKSNDITKSESTEMTLSVNLKVNDVFTKADDDQSNSVINGTDAVNDQEVTSCSIIVLDGSTVLEAKDGVTVTDGKINTTFSLKEKSGLKVVVVANVGAATTYRNCGTFAEVQAVTLGAADLNAKVKYGEADIVIGTANAETKIKPATAAVTVTQMTARIELASFGVTFKEGTKPVNVKITKVELLNANTGSKTMLNDQTGKSILSSALVWADSDNNAIEIPVWTADGTATGSAVEIATRPAFYTFPNFDGEKPVTMRLYLTYDRTGGDGKTFTADFAINRPTKDGDFENETSKPNEHSYIKAGYLYRVAVKAALTSNSFVLESIEVCTKDWVTNIYEVKMTPLN